MAKTGVITTGLPTVIGSDFCGVVTEVDKDCKRLKTGDYVYSCCNLGQSKYSPFQQTFLVDEPYVFKKSDNISAAQASAVGVAALVSFMSCHLGITTVLTLKRLLDWVLLQAAKCGCLILNTESLNEMSGS